MHYLHYSQVTHLLHVTRHVHEVATVATLQTISCSPFYLSATVIVPRSMGRRCIVYVADINAFTITQNDSVYLQFATCTFDQGIVQRMHFA